VAKECQWRANQLSRVLDQATEDRKYLRRERHHVAIVQELLVGVAGKAREPITTRRRRGEPTSDCFLTAI